jgi:hypothetical protein
VRSMTSGASGSNIRKSMVVIVADLAPDLLRFTYVAVSTVDESSLRKLLLAYAYECMMSDAVEYTRGWKSTVNLRRYGTGQDERINS